MEIYDLFKRKETEIPRDWYGVDFYNSLRKDLDEFINVLNQVDFSIDGFSLNLNSVNIKSECLDLRNEILESVSNYLSGSPSGAYLTLENSLNSRINILESLYTIPLGTNDFELYRVRESGKYPLTKENIFHVPISGRFSVRSNRYSIPGFPCLYLGSSLFISIIENRQLNLSKLNAARFKFRQPVRVLNFGYTNSTIDELLQYIVKFNWQANVPTPKQDLVELLRAHVIFYPLMIASSYRVQYSDGEFKPEYIIPQLILQFIKKNSKNIEGIRFISSHVDKTYDFDKQLNFIFPVQDFVNVDYCTWLRSRFELTNPIELKSVIKIDYYSKTILKMAYECEQELKKLPLEYF